MSDPKPSEAPDPVSVDHSTSDPHPHPNPEVAESLVEHPPPPPSEDIVEPIDLSKPVRADISGGYRWRAIGENIAAGHTQVEAAVQDWLGSQEHCTNLMSPDYTEMATAFAVNNSSSAGIYWVQVFGTAR